MAGAGLAPLTLARAATSWRAEPVGIVVSALLVAGYLAGVRRVRDERWPPGRTVVFLVGGVGSVLLTTCSFLGVYAPALRWVAVVQAALLVLVCPLLLGLGSPVALIAAARTRRAVPAPVLGFLKVLGAPGVGALVMIGVLSLLVFTPWLSWTQGGLGPRAVTTVVLLAAGLPLALPVADHGAEISSTAYAAMLGLGLVEFLLDAVPGMVLRLDTHVVAAGHWLALNRTWGPSPLSDQRLAGDWLWFFAEAGDVPFLIMLVVAWIRSDAREAAEVDAVLDRQEQELEIPGQPGMMRPWWQTGEGSPHGPGR